MDNTTGKLKYTLNNKNIKNKEKLERQQEYYRRLTKEGVAQKQTYNLKPISSI